MVVSSRIRGGDPPCPRGKTAVIPDYQQKYIQNNVSAQKQTIGIPRASRNIVRELKELDQAIQSVGRVDDDSTGGEEEEESQRDEYLVGSDNNNTPDTHVVETHPIVGRSSSSRVSRKSHRNRGSGLEEAVKKTVLLAAAIESNGSHPVRNNNKLPSPDIDFILSDLNRAVPASPGEKSPSRVVPMTPRYRTPVASRAKSKEPTSSTPHKDSKTSIKRETAESEKATKGSFDNNTNDEWNPFDSSTCITSWASDVKFNDSFARSSFVADFDNAFVITSQLSM